MAARAEHDMGQRGLHRGSGPLGAGPPHGAVRQVTSSGVLSRVVAQPSQRSVSRKKPRPCKCGCGGDTGTRHHLWIPGHYTRQHRADNWARTRRTWAYKRRAQVFLREIDRLGRRCTREDLLAIMQDVDRRGYMSGFIRGRKRWLDHRKLAHEAAA